MAERLVIRLEAPGYVPLADYCRDQGLSVGYAQQAAARGRIPGAILMHPVGAPAPIWMVPVTCTWRPGPRGRRKKDAGHAHPTTMETV